MGLYELIRAHFNIIRTEADKLNFQCKHCGKKLYTAKHLRGGGVSFDWDNWNIDVVHEFEYLESRANYHLLFKCKDIYISNKTVKV